MERVLAGLIIGLISALLWPTLPATWVGGTILVIGLCLISRASFISGCLLGAALCILLINHQFNDLAYLFKPNSSIKGTVISLPQQGKFSSRFKLRVNTINERASNATVIVYWPGIVNVEYGDLLILKGHGRPLHGSLNQGGFNYQRYLVGNKVSATITVKEGEIIKPQKSWKHSLKSRFASHLARLSQGHYIQALALGDRSLLGDKHWLTLKSTGTGHLFAISGLHLSLVALFSFWLFKKLFSCLVHSSLIEHTQVICSGLSVIVCFGYAYLSGFSLPTQRAFIILAVLLAMMMIKQRISLAHKLGISLLLVLLINPTAILTASLWLSFGAILLIYALVATQNKGALEEISMIGRLLHWFKQLISLQLWLFLGLLGINLSFFGGLSLVAPIANLFAVPIVSIIVLPLTLISLLLESTGASIWATKGTLMCVNWVLEVLFWCLELLQELDGSWVVISESYYRWFAFLITIIIVLAWQSSYMSHWRKLLLCAPALIFIFLFLWQVNARGQDWQVTFLDVGHGNAAVVIKHGRAIVVDTGKSFSNSSVASRTIEPFLDNQGISDLDYIIVTHDDNDHSGGLADLVRRYPKAKIISNQSNVGDTRAQHCKLLNNIDWLQLKLVFAQAPLNIAKTDNDRSCLVRLSDEKHSVLFVGDIQKTAERYFSKTLSSAWQSDVLQISHHGSKTSSSESFLDKVSPSIGIISSSRFNQWGFPHVSVLKRLKKLGVETYSTATDGQISIRFSKKQSLVTTYRKNISPFWYNRDLSFGHYD